MADVIVLGAGIIGVCVAIHLQRRGRSVLLVDRREPGRETSYGNAGIIQQEGVRPHSFPRDLASLMRVAVGAGFDVRYDFGAMPALAPALSQYWWHSAPERYRRIVADYAPLIAQSVAEHADLIAAAGADDLIQKSGWLWLARSTTSRDALFEEAKGDLRDYGVQHRLLDADAIAELEPDLMIRAAGAVQWTEPWTVRDPGALAAAYARAVRKASAARFAQGDARTLVQPMVIGLEASTTRGRDQGRSACRRRSWRSAPGPTKLTAPARLPAAARGQARLSHALQAARQRQKLNNWMLDTERGYLLAPMLRASA
jgi:D-amino-acid dehydrogenase